MYALSRAQRADGTESIVITAPLYLFNKKEKEEIPNLVGIAKLMMMAELSKSNFKFIYRNVLFHHHLNSIIHHHHHHLNK